MTVFPQRFISAATESLVWSPFLGVCGYAGGYFIASLSKLPPSQAARHWAIYAVAAHTLSTLAISLSENEGVQGCLQATVIGGTSLHFIGTMRKLGLMGNKMMISLSLFHTFAVLTLLHSSLERGQTPA